MRCNMITFKASKQTKGLPLTASLPFPSLVDSSGAERSGAGEGRAGGEYVCGGKAWRVCGKLHFLVAFQLPCLDSVP